jgi:hypothetical protein
VQVPLKTKVIAFADFGGRKHIKHAAMTIARAAKTISLIFTADTPNTQRHGAIMTHPAMGSIVIIRGRNVKEFGC